MISKIISFITGLKIYAKIICIFFGLLTAISIFVYSSGYLKGKNDCEQKNKDAIIENQKEQDLEVKKLPASQKERLEWLKKLKVRL